MAILLLTGIYLLSKTFLRLKYSSFKLVLSVRNFLLFWVCCKLLSVFWKSLTIIKVPKNVMFGNGRNKEVVGCKLYSRSRFGGGQNKILTFSFISKFYSLMTTFRKNKHQRFLTTILKVFRYSTITLPHSVIFIFIFLSVCELS